MNILIINGSPKGPYSITLHTALFLAKKFPEHTFNYLHVGQHIKALEKDFSPAITAITQAELLVFTYPVYTFIAPSQLHRFIELLKGQKLDLSAKVATQITTSKHFYDMTAHRYIADNCQDLGLKYLDGLSADMDDLLTPRGQQEAQDFFKLLLWQKEKGFFRPAMPAAKPFVPVAVPEAVTVEHREDKKVIIVADLGPEDIQLSRMIDYFIASMPYKTRVFNISEFNFLGGCISCFNCATSGQCFYQDHFDTILREQIQDNDAIIYAFTIKDHSMGSRFKMYDDRQFCNGHRTVTMGTPFGYLISGPYRQEENLRLILESRAQVGGNYLAGVATDETAPAAAIKQLTATLCYAMENKLNLPANFWGVGGRKIFRDLIYLMRGMMRADHRFFKQHGQYDFPQKKWKTSWLMYLVGFLMSHKNLTAKMGGKMKEGMIKSYKEVVDQA